MMRKVHMIGIGGVGISALAQLLLERGVSVSGSDKGEWPTMDLLRKKGVHIDVGYKKENVPPDAEMIIYTDAEGEMNPERVRGKELRIKERSYFKALGEIVQDSELIAIAGTHGKTTTTAMLIDVLEAGGFDPEAIVGSLRAKTKSNFRAGHGKHFVVEADEFKRHFLNFYPHILVITNLEADHLDYYENLEEIQSVFRELAERVPHDGYIICDTESETVRPVIEGLACTIIDYKKFLDPALKLKGLSFNRINAAPALATAHVLGVPSDTARKALEEFSGVWRRFEYKGETSGGALVYDDYAHHPSEIETTLASVRTDFPDKRIIVAFHPHLFSRTKIFLNDFARALHKADSVLVAPIFAAREEPDPAISSEILVEKIRLHGTEAFALSVEEIVQKLATRKTGDLIITMGAGDIYKAGERLLK